MSEALKPCPFCGSTDIQYDDHSMDHYGLDIPGVDCRGCGVRNFQHSEKEAIAAWNRRAPATLPTVEELKDLFMEQDGIVITWPKALYFATITHEYLTRRMGGES